MAQDPREPKKGFRFATLEAMGASPREEVPASIEGDEAPEVRARVHQWKTLEDRPDDPDQKEDDELRPPMKSPIIPILIGVVLGALAVAALFSSC